jgi:hypothetical protein
LSSPRFQSLHAHCYNQSHPGRRRCSVLLTVLISNRGDSTERPSVASEPCAGADRPATRQPAKQTRTSGRPRVTARPSVYGRHTIFQIGRNDSPWGFIGPQRSEIGDRSPQAKPPTGQHFAQCPAGRSQAASDASPALRPFCLDTQFEPPTWSKTRLNQVALASAAAGIPTTPNAQTHTSGLPGVVQGYLTARCGASVPCAVL